METATSDASQIVRRSCMVEGVRLSYLVRGEASEHKPSLLVVHGLMGSAATFAEFLRAVPGDRHVIALDLPGAGDSDRPRQMGLSLYGAAGTVRAFCAEMHLTRPVLMGHSHGGAVGLYLAALEPELLGGLVLLAPAHPYFRQADQLIRFYLSPLGAAFAHTMPWYPRWVQMAGLRRMAGPKSWDTPERLTPYRANLRTRGTIGHLLRLLRTWHVDMSELKRLLQAPFRLRSLVIWGDHDRAVPMSSAYGLLSRLRNGELRIMEGVGHRPAEERAALCADWVDEWMRCE